MLVRLLAHMDRQQFHPTVISLTGPGQLGEQIEALGIPLYSLGMRRGMPSPDGTWRLMRILRREKPDVVQTWLYHADLLGALASSAHRTVPLVWNLRCSDVDMAHYGRFSRWTVLGCAGLSRLPRAVIANSESGRAYHEQLGYRPRQWKVIPNGIEIDRFRPDSNARASMRAELGIKSNEVLIGRIARYDPMKDHETFFRAAGLLAQAHPLVRFLLAGKGISAENAAIRQWIAAERLGDRVHLLGRRTDIARLTNALDISTSSSRWGEGFPNVVGEAMACGVPCVTTNSGDSARIVDGTGFVIPPRNPQSLVDGWQRLMDLGATGRSHLGQRARERILSHYNLDQIAESYAKFYASLS